MSPKTRLIAAIMGGVAILALILGWAIITGRLADKSKVAAADRQSLTISWDWPSIFGGREKSWSSDDRRSFITSCVEKCRAAPGVTADRYPLCDSACACAADEGQKLMTGAELGAAAQAISSGTATTEQTAKMSSINTAAMACVPADKRP